MGALRDTRGGRSLEPWMRGAPPPAGVPARGRPQHRGRLGKAARCGVLWRSSRVAELAGAGCVPFPPPTSSRSGGRVGRGGITPWSSSLELCPLTLSKEVLCEGVGTTVATIRRLRCPVAQHPIVLALADGRRWPSARPPAAARSRPASVPAPCLPPSRSSVWVPVRSRCGIACSQCWACATRPRPCHAARPPARTPTALLVRADGLARGDGRRGRGAGGLRPGCATGGCARHWGRASLCPRNGNWGAGEDGGGCRVRPPLPRLSSLSLCFFLYKAPSGLAIVQRQPSSLPPTSPSRADAVPLTDALPPPTFPPPD